MTLRRACPGALAVLLAGAQAASGAAGTTPFEFLSLDANARPVALGGAYTALAADSNALLYNPAGLGLVESHEATFMHDQHFEGVHQEYASFAARQGWGLQLNYLSYGELPKTTISNKTGAGLGSYGISDLAFSGGYGRKLLPGLSVGGALKYIRESLENVSGQGTALDAGVLYVPEALPGARFGAAFRNFGPDVKFQREDEKLPLQLRFGAAYSRPLLGQALTMALDVVKARGDGPGLCLGVEAVLAERLPVRLGYDRRNDAGPGLTAGFGWIQGPAQFDYAFVSYGDLGAAHRVSATLRWGEPRETRAVTAAPVYRAPLARSAPAPAPAAPAPQPAAAPERPAMPDVPPHLWLSYRLNEAQRLLAAQRTAEAESQLREAEPLLAQQPAQRVLFLNLHGRAAHQRRAGNALDYYLEAVSAAAAADMSGEEVADAHAGAAQCLLELNRPREAEDHLRLGLEAHPSEKTRRFLEDRLRTVAPKGRAAAWSDEF